jgi:cbb3-type cytochrome oxidase maturation protein
MNYVFGWMGLVAISLWISLVAFVWAVKSGQFAEQQRLRYLPLRDQPAVPPAGDPGRLPVEVYALLGIGGCVIAIFLAAVFLSLITA